MTTGSPLRILYAIRERYPTNRIDVEILFAEELAGRGHRIDLVMFCASAGIRPGRHRWKHANVIVPGVIAGLTELVARWRAVRRWLGVVVCANRSEYEAIQVRDMFVAGAVALLVCRLRGMRCYFWLSYPYPEDDLLRARTGNARAAWLVRCRGHVTGWLLRQVLLRHTDHVFVQSERMRRELSAAGGSLDRMTAVPMGVADVDVRRLPARPPSSRPTIAYVGTLNLQRNPQIMVDALWHLRQSGVDARLLLVGDGDVAGERAVLEEHIRRRELEQHVEITGFLPRATALERLAEADVAWSPIAPLPVFRVASPTKLIEYLALGIPSVANAHPDQDQVLRESRAGLSVPWGARHFARATRVLLALPLDRRLAMGERGREWVLANRTYSRLADRVQATYYRLRDSRDRRSQ